jgi:hypothetical protein
MTTNGLSRKFTYIHYIVPKFFIQKKCYVKTAVDVMITIFGDFWQFSAKKLAFFSKTNVMIKILYILALFWVKNAEFFAEFFGENILKNHNIGPWSGHPAVTDIIFWHSRLEFESNYRSMVLADKEKKAKVGIFAQSQILISLVRTYVCSFENEVCPWL